MNRPLYHYTTGTHLSAILETGALIPTGVGVEDRERPVVWFSSAPKMEPTARKGWGNDAGFIRTLSMDETHKLAGGLYRFRLSPKVPTLDLQGYRDSSGISPIGFKGLVIAGRRQGANPHDWRVSFISVPLSEIEALEAWNGKAWIERPIS
jgi:hypothetical protein